MKSVPYSAYDGGAKVFLAMAERLRRDGVISVTAVLRAGEAALDALKPRVGENLKMGVNICVMKPDGSEHPDWDDLKYSGDRHFMAWMSGLDRQYSDEDDELFRPINIREWRDALPPDRDNVDRFPQMFDILEREPEYWIYISW